MNNPTEKMKMVMVKERDIHTILLALSYLKLSHEYIDDVVKKDVGEIEETLASILYR